MNFTKLFLLIVMLVLAACGSVPERETTAEDGSRVKQNIPEGAEQNYQLALQSIDQQDWPSAVALLQAMQTQYPTLNSVTATLGWVYWQQGDIDNAQETLAPLIGNETLFKPDAYMTLALIYREQGLFKQAEALYTQAIEIWPNDTQLLINAGILQDLYLGQLDKALAYYQQANATSTERNPSLEGWIKDLERRL